MAKKVLLYSDQGGLPSAQHSTIPSVCSHLRPFLLGLILAFHEVLPARTRQRWERKHPQPLPNKNGNIRRSRLITPVANDPTKPANPQPMEAISRPAK